MTSTKRLGLLFAICLAGCQYGVRINGHVPDAADCMLSINLVDGNKDSLPPFPQQLSVSGAFSKLVTLDPMTHRYSLIVQCDRRVVMSREFSYPSEVNSSKPLDLGNIEL
jgi:hypothetical protein